MSNARFSIVQSRAVTDERISDSQYRTLSALGTFGDKDGWCWPKLETLGEMRHKSKQAVSRDIQELQKMGYLEIHKQVWGNGFRRNNKYRLLFDTVSQQEIDLVSTPEVDAVSIPEVDAASTPEVDALTPQKNDPINAPLEYPWERDILNLYGFGDLGNEALKTKLNNVAYSNTVGVVEKFGIEKFLVVLTYYANQDFNLPRAIGKAVNAIHTWRWNDNAQAQKVEVENGGAYV